jgi:hypothetical protein
MERSDMPTSMGYWILLFSSGELMKYGKNEDTIFPYKAVLEMLRQARFLNKTKLDGDVIYIAEVFSNGQMKHYDYPE